MGSKYKFSKQDIYVFTNDVEVITCSFNHQLKQLRKAVTLLLSLPAVKTEVVDHALECADQIESLLQDIDLMEFFPKRGVNNA